jgi:hypothetical protein
MLRSPNSRKIQWRLFLAAWLTYAFFHQGGGWNQNGRFAMVRSVVEEGRFSIDSYLFYSGSEETDGGPRLVRTPIDDGTIGLRGARWAVAWAETSTVSVTGQNRGLALVPLERISATGDVSYAGGHFYPNKAPGTALLAVPAYFLIYHAERSLGLDPDDWWILTVNGWLTTALSVGLISALGCVLFLRVAWMLWGGSLRAATWATLAFAFGTLFFPYSTMLFEHNVVAVGLLGAFHFILAARPPSSNRRARLQLFLAGTCAGLAAISTYVAVVPVLFLGAYMLARVPRRRAWLGFGIGLAGPFLLVCSYNWICFSTPFTTNYHFQNPQFLQSGAFLSVLGAPRLDRLAGVLISPFRGLFFSSPVLLVGVVGWVAMWRGEKRAEALLFSSILAFFVLFNVSFNGWHGGWGVGPRYLIPALPFLALPLTLGFQRYFRTTSALAIVSALTMLCFTAVDVQSPVGTSSIARIPGRPTLLREPLTEYALPILFTGTARPILDAQIEDAVHRAEQLLSEQGAAPETRNERLARYRERLERSATSGDSGFSLALFAGPVSANPSGLYEGWFGRVFDPGGTESDWNAFNAGELLLPRSTWSLLLLLCIWVPLVGSAIGLSSRSSESD